MSSQYSSSSSDNGSEYSLSPHYQYQSGYASSAGSAYDSSPPMSYAVPPQGYASHALNAQWHVYPAASAVVSQPMAYQMPVQQNPQYVMYPPQYTYATEPFQHIAQALQPVAATHEDQRPSRRSQPSTASRPYRCEQPGCERGEKPFKRKADLYRHLKTVHNIGQPDLLDCEVMRCDRRGERGFSRKDHLVEHMRDAHALEAKYPKKRKSTMDLNGDSARRQTGGRPAQRYP